MTSAGYCYPRVEASGDLVSAEERAWPAEYGPIIFVSQSNNPPFEFRNEDGEMDGKWLGIALLARFSREQMLDCLQRFGQDLDRIETLHRRKDGNLIEVQLTPSLFD